MNATQETPAPRAVKASWRAYAFSTRALTDVETARAHPAQPTPRPVRKSVRQPAVAPAIEPSLEDAAYFD